MSTTVNSETTESWSSQDTRTGWTFPPIYTIEPRPATLSALDRKILLTIHAVTAVALMATIPVLTLDPNVRAYIDLAVLTYITIPAILMAGLDAPARSWWAVASPIVSALYLWLPSAATGSVYVEAHSLSIVALALFAPMVSALAPFVLFARTTAGPWTLAGYGTALLAAPGIVYASLAYPLFNSLG